MIIKLTNKQMSTIKIIRSGYWKTCHKKVLQKLKFLKNSTFKQEIFLET